MLNVAARESPSLATPPHTFLVTFKDRIHRHRPEEKTQGRGVQRLMCVCVCVRCMSALHEGKSGAAEHAAEDKSGCEVF